MATPEEQRLREAFASRPGNADLDQNAIDSDLLWRAVSGELPAEERRAIVARLADDPDAARDWQLAHDLFEAQQAQLQGPAEVRSIARKREPRPAPRVTASRRTQLWLAAAAILVAVIAGLLFRSQLQPGEPSSVLRAAQGPTIESLVADGAVLDRQEPTLSWVVTGLPGAQAEDPGDRTDALRYDLTVLGPEGTPIVTERNLESASYTLSASELASVPPGSELLWQVDARLSDGSRIRSVTFVALVP